MDEPFYTISLDIKNKKDILEALSLYVRGDMLEGDNAYFCSKCSKHVDTLKRSCIKVISTFFLRKEEKVYSFFLFADTDSAEYIDTTSQTIRIQFRYHA